MGGKREDPEDVNMTTFKTDHRDTTGGPSRSHRVECWLSRKDYYWLKAVAQREESSLSGTLRQALEFYLQATYPGYRRK